MERGLIAERKRAGLYAALKLGWVDGRKQQKTKSKNGSVRELIKGEVAPKDVTNDLVVSVLYTLPMVASVSTIIDDNYHDYRH